VILGLLGGFAFIIGMNLAVSAVGATITAFVAGLYAVLAALFAPVVLGERLQRRAIAGFAVALVGTALLAELAVNPATIEGLPAGGVAAVSYGLYLVLIRRWSAAIDVGPIGISLATSGTSTAGLVIVLAALDPGGALPAGSPSAEVVVATGWLALVTAVGPLLATAALRRIEASFASSLLLLNPITATVLAVILLAEWPSPVQLLGAGLVLVGIAAATDLPGTLRTRRAARSQPSRLQA
jgi:drug/metabolite transporter (DMT)-like permease